MLKPLNDNILVQRREQESVSKGGIIIPDSAKEKPAEAIIEAVGPGNRANDGTRIAPDVKPGELVLFGKFMGTEVKLNGEDYVILREQDILAVIEA